MSSETMPTLFGRGTAIFKEHADLRPMVAKLREHATALALGRPTEELDVENLLDEFFDQLLAHFAAEENEGYFGTFIEDYPDLSVHVERLMAEHEEMVDAVERLRSLDERSANSRDLGLGLLALLGQFEGHEREENLLVRTFLSMAPRPDASFSKRGD
jgi:hemerythrin